MTEWVHTVFVGPGVEGREIEVINLFPVDYHVIQFDGIGTSTEERVSGFEPGDQFEGIDELTYVLVVLLDSFPFAFPHDHDIVTCSEQSIFLASSGFVHVTHGLVTHLVTRPVTVWETFGTPMPETTVEFVYGAGLFVVPVHVVGLVSAQDHVLTSVASVTNVDVGFSIQVREPFQSGERIPAQTVSLADLTKKLKNGFDTPSQVSQLACRLLRPREIEEVDRSEATGECPSF